MRYLVILMRDTLAMLKEGGGGKFLLSKCRGGGHRKIYLVSREEGGEKGFGPTIFPFYTNGKRQNKTGAHVRNIESRPQKMGPAYTKINLFPVWPSMWPVGRPQKMKQNDPSCPLFTHPAATPETAFFSSLACANQVQGAPLILKTVLVKGSPRTTLTTLLINLPTILF